MYSRIEDVKEDVVLAQGREGVVDQGHVVMELDGRNKSVLKLLTLIFNIATWQLLKIDMRQNDPTCLFFVRSSPCIHNILPKIVQL